MSFDKNKIKKFDFLKEKALELGAVDSKIISVDNVYVENRVVLKCQLGCIDIEKN